MLIRTLAAPLLALACTGFNASAMANDGIYDPTFGNYLPGRSVVNLFEDPDMSMDKASSMLVLPDGAMIIAGKAIHGAETMMAAVRLDASGQLDPTFGNDGVALVFPAEVPSALETHAVLRQSDGKLLLVGLGFYGLQASAAACRLHANGTPDTAYGENGCVHHAPQDGHRFRHAQVVAVLDASDRILIAGVVASDSAPTVDIGLIRVVSNGTLDTTFADDGLAVITRLDEIAQTTTDESAHALALDAAGRIVLAGSVRPRHDNEWGEYAMAFARLDADGALDPQFGDGGAQRIVFGLDTVANAMTLTTDGGIVACGAATIHGSYPIDIDFAVARLDAQGVPDSTFDGDGRLILPFHPGNSGEDVCAAVAMQADGRIVLAGHARSMDGSDFDLDLALVRLWPDGRGDDGFGNRDGGRFIGPLNLGIDESDNTEQLVAVTIRDQRLMAVGYAEIDYNQHDFVAIRLLADRIFGDGFD